MKIIAQDSFLIFACLIFSGCDQNYIPGTPEHIQSVTLLVDDDRLLNADLTGDWLTYGRNYQEDRFSPLSQVTKSNIDQLGLAWSVNLGTKRGIEATPLVVDGIMYVTGPWSLVFAIDALSGQLIWRYDPEVPKENGKNACCDVVNRGVALYRGLVFLGALDGRLIALNAATGEPAWEVLTVDKSYPYTITGAPRVINGQVIIGNGGAEYGVRGYVTAYDALTGKQKWRFHTVPGDPTLPFESKALEEAAKTWTGEWWKYGGGGTAWDAMAFDPELNLLYVGVGNGAPWNRMHRSPGGGDNLYLSSVVALNPDNGELVWYYQTTPGDTWDYTATQHIILADLEIEGQLRKVLMQAPKNGFFYVLDRTNGDFISAEPYVYVNWASSIDPETGRPLETPFARYTDQDAEIFPSIYGGHNWQPMAYNQNTGLVYFPARELSMTYGNNPDWEFKPGQFNGALGRNPNQAPLIDTLGPKPLPQGRLVAWDPVKQEEVWRVSHESAWNGGVLTTTTGLVFQGTADGRLVAYDAENSDKLWEFELGTGIIAAPMTFEIDGEQYVSIAAGWGGARGMNNQFTDYIYPGTVYTFRLNGDTPRPEYPKPPPKELADFDYDNDETFLAKGSDLYIEHCAQCHGAIARGTGGVLPDLGYISQGAYDIFDEIVLNGAFLAKGMPSFGQQLNQEEVAAIRNFVAAAAGKKIAEHTES
ncbi:MAG: PQQ-dependent dehydrogenase, methanol/ethanol family [Cyclobacteriaceae bacterium]